MHTSSSIFKASTATIARIYPAPGWSASSMSSECLLTFKEVNQCFMGLCVPEAASHGTAAHFQVRRKITRAEASAPTAPSSAHGDLNPSLVYLRRLTVTRRALSSLKQPSRIEWEPTLCVRSVSPRHQPRYLSPKSKDSCLSNGVLTVNEVQPVKI